MVKNLESSRRDRRVIGPSFRKNKMSAKSPKRTRSQGVRAHSPTTVGAVLDLSVIDRAFGDFSDLYDDVLRVSQHSTQKQIQAGFFDRRSELFAVLSKLDSRTDEITLGQRMYAERRMDAIVVAFRILRDSQMRREYDSIRDARMVERAKLKGTAAPTKIKADQKKNRNLFSLGRSDSESPRSVATDGFDSDPTLSPPQPPRGGGRKNGRQAQGESIMSFTSDDKGALPRSRKSAFGLPPHRRGKTTQQRSRKQERPNSPDEAPSPATIMTDASGTTVSGAESSAYGLVTIETNAESTVFSTGDTTMTSGVYTETSETMMTGMVSTDDESRSLVLATRSDDDSLISMAPSQRAAARARAEKGGAGILDRIRRHPMVAAITEEVEGSVQDTVSAFDQVFNVFTLTDEDISAVCGRINKAQRLYRES